MTQMTITEVDRKNKSITVARTGDYGTFNAQVDGILNRGTYDPTQGAGPIWEVCKTLPHALGEIVYKAIRYHKKRNPDDLVKIAAWARLAWEEHCNADAGRTEPGGKALDRLAWTPNTRPRTGSADSSARDAGGPPGGSGRGALTEALAAKARNDVKAAVRTKASLRRSKHVDSKSRRRKAKR